VAGLSPEGRFQLAYAAALGLAAVAVLASGHRIRTRARHHQLAFEAAGLALGRGADSLVGYLEICRRRRNVISYEGDEIGQEVANELVREATRFSEMVHMWLKRTHPELL
jgi:hypothetical protein